MADKSAIEWTDATWNPVTGCTKVSPGCDNCYAETFAERFRGVPGHHFEQGFDLTLRPERLDKPLRWTRPRRIFVNSMSDLFHDQVPDEYIARVFAVMALARQHTFQVLTKRHGRMRSLLTSPRWSDLFVEAWQNEPGPDESSADVENWPPLPLPNVWLGVSVEDQRWADIRIPALLDTPAAIRWISAEPLLGPINLGRYLGQHAAGPGPANALAWVVAGGESGRNARPMHPDWARALRDQCVAAGVGFHFKQWGEFAPSGHPELDRPHLVEADGSHRPYPMRLGIASHPRDGQWFTYRVGRKAAGRELDGRTWDEYPQAVTE